MDEQADPTSHPDPMGDRPAEGSPSDPRRGFTETTYAQFRAIAAEYLRRERRDHTLQPTALVNEAYLRLGGATESGFADRQHFVAAVARAMRNILVDHARAHNAQKRGGHAVTIDIAAQGSGGPAASAERADRLDLVELDDALGKLEALDARQARVVELRFFGGLSVRETAGLLGVSDRTIESDWRVARAWLRRELRGGERGNQPPSEEDPA